MQGKTTFDTYKIRGYERFNFAKVIILFNPNLDYEENKVSEREMVIIQRLVRDNGFYFISMLDYYRQNFKCKRGLWIKGRKNAFTGKQDFIHSNEKEHKAIADALLKTILAFNR